MEKKFKFSDNPNFTKTVYGIVVAILCITAIIVGIVAANSRNDDDITVDNPIGDSSNEDNKNPGNQPPSTEDEPGEDKPNEKPQKKPEKKSFLAPAAGAVSKGHSLTVPVFSTTLEEWRVHSGIDITSDEGAQVFAVFDGEVEKVYNDPLLGCTVVIDHGSDVKTFYSNLANNESLAKVGDTLSAGECIGNIGDTSISELAEEPHLHFEVSVGDSFVDPLEYISDESKSASLQISAAD